MKSKKKVVMGVDIGGTKIAIAFLDAKKSNKLVTPIYTVKTHNGKQILNVLHKFFKKFSNKFHVVAMGISTAGMVSNKGRIVGSSWNIKGWNGIRIKEILEKKCKVPVVVENDANTAAYAEYCMGLAKGANPLILVILGTGVGGGIIINGQLLRGAHFAGGEIGHTKLSFSKHRLCTCGKYDCFEAYASGKGLVSLAKHYFPDNNKLHSTRAIFKLVKNKKNKKRILALRAIEDWHYYVAEGLSNLVQSFDPEKIVLSGGLASQINLNLLQCKASKLLLPCLEKLPKKGLIIKSRFGNDAGLLGAALLAKDLV